MYQDSSTNVPAEAEVISKGAQLTTEIRSNVVDILGKCPLCKEKGVSGVYVAEGRDGLGKTAKQMGER